MPPRPRSRAQNGAHPSHTNARQSTHHKAPRNQEERHHNGPRSRIRSGPQRSASRASRKRCVGIDLKNTRRPAEWGLHVMNYVGWIGKANDYYYTSNAKEPTSEGWALLVFQKNAAAVNPPPIATNRHNKLIFDQTEYVSS